MLVYKDEDIAIVNGGGSADNEAASEELVIETSSIEERDEWILAIKVRFESIYLLLYDFLCVLRNV